MSAFQNFAAQLVVDNQIILFCKKLLGAKSNERLTEQVVTDPLRISKILNRHAFLHVIR